MHRVVERSSQHLRAEADPQIGHARIDRLADVDAFIGQERVPLAHVDVHLAAVERDPGDLGEVRELGARVGEVLDPGDVCVAERLGRDAERLVIGVPDQDHGSHDEPVYRRWPRDSVQPRSK